MTLVFDIGGLSTKIAFIDSQLNIVKRDSIDYPNYIEAKELETKICKFVNDNISEIDKISISTCGIVDEASGQISGLSAVKNYNTNWKKILEKFNKNVYVVNDAKAATIAELKIGNGKNFNSFIVLVIGTGIGGRVVINKEILESKNKLAGEFGCMISSIGDNEKLTNFSEAASAKTISEIYNKISNKNLQTEEVFKIKDIDQNANKAINDVAKKISKLIVNISFVLDYDKVLVGGGISLSEHFINLINEYCEIFYKNIGLKKHFDVEKTKFSNDSNLLGAYCNSL